MAFQTKCQSRHGTPFIWSLRILNVQFVTILIFSFVKNSTKWNGINVVFFFFWIRKSTIFCGHHCFAIETVLYNSIIWIKCFHKSNKWLRKSWYASRFVVQIIGVFYCSTWSPQRWFAPYYQAFHLDTLAAVWCFADFRFRTVPPHSQFYKQTKNNNNKCYKKKLSTAIKTQ